MRDFAHLITWPIVAIAVVLLFISEIRLLLRALTVKIERATRIKIGKAGVELAEEVARGKIMPANPIDVKLRPEDLKAEFDELARTYDDLKLEDVHERAAARMKIADRLGQLAMQMKLPRSALAESRSEAKLVALATIAVTKPMAADLAALEKASQTANFKFTRYRLVLGLLPILSRPALSASTLQRVEKIIDNVERAPNNPPDAPLERLLTKTRATVADLYATLT